ncbi:hypothetical protein MTR_3g452690 [Medicago truncatula]|uniref:Uncharacterized protein n=1 Tax=Medicago truncatula TaxID=3880 RepID=A0A072UVZ9_MEDTR|nr:hypothetical protein MTR_3g452690 [Medicago truncatula]
MAANSNSNIETLKEKEDEVIYDAEPISCKFSKGFTAEWMNNWEIKETPRSNGSRIDRTYHHKKRRLTLRSMIAVQNYEILGILPQRKRKTEVKGKGVIIADVENNESLAKKPKEHDENMSIPVEEFLTEARYNLLHWFDH